MQKSNIKLFPAIFMFQLYMKGTLRSVKSNSEKKTTIIKTTFKTILIFSKVNGRNSYLVISGAGTEKTRKIRQRGNQDKCDILASDTII